MFGIFKKKVLSEFPETIEVESVAPGDEEVLEEWVRVLDKNHVQFHSVYAYKLLDEEFSWYVIFGAAEFIRESPFVEQLNESVYRAIMRVDGVDSAFHEDTEKYVISGSPSGKALVHSVSTEVDMFIKENLAAWEDSVKA